MGRLLVIVTSAIAVLGFARDASAQSAPTCSLDGTTGTITVTMNGLVDTLNVTATGVIKLTTAAVNCGTVTNTDTVVVNGTGQLTIKGNYFPGKTAEATGTSEIEFSINNNLVIFDFWTGDDLIKVLNTGADVTGDGDQDITLSGTQTKVTYKAGDGNDVIDGSTYTGTLYLYAYGGNGMDHIIGGPNIDYLWGDADTDVVEGNGGNDKLWGGKGDDTVIGGDGKDTFMEEAIANGADYLEGGLGIDTVNYGTRTAALSVTLADGIANEGALGENDELVGVENVTAGSGDDTLVGDAAINTLKGGGGADDIYGNGGADKLYGDAGNDYIQGDAGNDFHYGGTGNDILVGDAAGTDKFFGQDGDDQIVDNADTKAENVDCGAGNDSAETAAEDTFLGCETLTPP